jgi:hypothetical protein
MMNDIATQVKHFANRIQAIVAQLTQGSLAPATILARPHPR